MMKKGFTLVEVLVTVLIFSFISMVMYSVLNVGYSVYSRLSVSLDLQQAKNGMDRMVREVRASSSATVTTIDASSDKITFTTPTSNGIQYYRNGTQLIREYPSGTTRIMADNIAFLKFTLTAPLLLIQLRADKILSGKTYSFSLTEKVRLRNE